MKRRNKKPAVYRLVFSLLVLIALLAIAGGKYIRPWQMDQKVMASEASQLHQALTAQHDLVQTVHAQDDQIDALQAQFNELMANPITFKQTYFLEHTVLPVTRECGIPDALAAGQWALESGRATSSPINNLFGIGPGWKFATLTDNVKSYCQTVKNILKHKGHDLSSTSDPLTILEYLQEGTFRYEGHNKDPHTYVEHVSSLPEFKTRL